MNNIASQSDKRGGALYTTWLVEGFNTALEEIGLNDMKLTRHQYTRERSRGTTNWIETRMGRAMTNNLWLKLFSLTKLYNLEGSPSHHGLIFLDTRKSLVQRVDMKHFRFENAWLTEPLCFQLVKDNCEYTNLVDFDKKSKSVGKK